jgi:hypothetical protein
MAASEAGAVFAADDIVTAPDCRACLRLLDRLTTAPAPDARLPVVTALTVDTVMEHGYAEVFNVPGDQLVLLRRALIRQLHGRGHHGNTHVVAPRDPTTSTLLVVWATDIEVERAPLPDVFAALFRQPPVSPERPWRIDWNTWALE